MIVLDIRANPLDLTVYPNVVQLMTLTAGATLQNGRYSIQSVLATHGTELIYEARHTYLEQLVHLKSVPESLWKDAMTPDDRQSFHQRSTVFAQSTSPHLVRIIDGFEEHGVPFLVLKPIAGQSLATWLQARQRLSRHEAIALLSPLVDAIASLHQSGITHGALGVNTLAIRHDRQMVVIDDIPLHSFLPPGAIANLPTADGLAPTVAQDIQGIAATTVALMTGTPMPTDQCMASAQAGTLWDRFDDLSEAVTSEAVTSEAIQEAIAQGLLAHPEQTLADWFASFKYAAQPSSSAVLNVSKDGDECDASQHGDDPSPSNDVPRPVPVENHHEQTRDTMAAAIAPPDFPISVPSTIPKEDAHSGPTDLIPQSGSQKTPTSPTSRSTSRHRWRIPVALGLCSLVAASVGGYLGVSFRLQEPEQLEQSPIFGREIFGTEQSFPVSDQWPGQSSAEFDEGDFLFEQRQRRSPYQSPTTLEEELIFPEVESEVDPSSPAYESPAYELLEEITAGADRDTPRNTDPSVQEGVITDEPPSAGTSPIIEPPPPVSEPAPLPPVPIPDGVEPPSTASPPPASDA